MKLIIRTLLAGLAIFAWGFISWGVLSWHYPREVANDAALAEAIKSSITEPGVYMVPSKMKTDGTRRSDEGCMKAMTDGPFMLAMIRPGASTRPMASMYVGGIVVALVQAALIAFILGHARLGYGGSIQLSAYIGLFAGLAYWLPTWNWFEYPVSYWLPYIADYVVQGILAAVILGRTVCRVEKPTA
ncbi:MAG: hypothetical protein ABMA13_04620 [Chthoniobacteraceae bacterium]